MSERKRLLLRLDPEIYESVARWAADDLRSVNAQIEYALRRALRDAGRAGSARADPPGDAQSPGGGGDAQSPGGGGDAPE